MSDLTITEQNHVRTALHYLRRRAGAWKSVADALHFNVVTVQKVAYRQRPVTPNMAFRVARLLNASVDDLLAGHFLRGACPRCGYVPDFADESTVAEDGPRPDGSGLKLVR